MKNIVLVLFLITAVSSLMAGQGLPIQRIESTIKDAESIFDGKTESFVTVRSGDYAAVSFSRPLRSPSCSFFASADGPFKVRVSISRDAVNWVARETVFRPNTGARSFPLSLPPGPAEYLSFEFSSAKGKTLSLAEVRIDEKPEMALSVEKIKVVFPKVTPSGPRSAVVNWSTPVETTGQVRYGRKTTDKVASELVFRKGHGIEIEGLQPGRIYQYEIIVSDGLKTYREGPLTFKVPGQPDLEAENIRIFPESWDRTGLTVVSSAPSLISISYAASNSTERITRPSAGTAKLTNSAILSNLLPATVYRATLVLQDRKGNAVTNRTSFLTPVRDVALGKPVTGTFTNRKIADSFELEGNVLSRITDGILDYRTGMAVSGDPAAGDQWFTVDLGNPWSVDRVILSFRGLCYPRDFTISLSPDGETWTQAAGRLDAGKGTDGLSASGDPMKIVTVGCEGRQARFVRFFMKKGSPYFSRFDFYRFVQLFEAQVIPSKE